MLDRSRWIRSMVWDEQPGDAETFISKSESDFVSTSPHNEIRSRRNGRNSEVRLPDRGFRGVPEAFITRQDCVDHFTLGEVRWHVEKGGEERVEEEDCKSQALPTLCRRPTCPFCRQAVAFQR